ncbi:uncharacterized protein LOC113508198 [Trichoplusia ni]|uniref:Uncharacterized protein LOC113508198 n=1 Tax=Trichoplusia ni TaxID=7111 RepID=A0A7E5X3J8_TRINI|nr:uncharacterized protein LOC113508198 [Trichoplusia ni]
MSILVLNMQWVTQGTEMFNQKPERGIEFLQEHGVLTTPLDPHEVAIFLRENPDLDKKMIREYICKRSSRGEDEDGGPSVLGAFADIFDYAGLRIDQALRLYLETFRLPGEAPLNFLVMERFAERWHSTNGDPSANTDAAFRLVYSVIMLNMDQHNHNAKKLNVPMTVEDFVKNLRGLNGSEDFDQIMLEAIFHSIKNEEMVMPAERTGLVREAYLWRVLQHRGAGNGTRYRAVPAHHQHHARLLTVACPPTWVTQATEMFNQKPERGIEFLQEHGVLTTPLDPHEVAIFLRENPDLDKKMIREYICKRSSRGEDEDGGPSVLGAFADIFDYAGLRIDQALRLYLETFRLPGEAPLNFLVMERFAERWHSTNGDPSANTDAAFRLVYSVIMLNMDQHNHNAKKLNVPMTVEDFVKNLRGLNGSEDFDQIMLEAIFHSIKNEEMVMPAERTGLVREAYLWRVLQRRGAGNGTRYRAVPAHHQHHARLLTVACPPTVSTAHITTTTCGWIK